MTENEKDARRSADRLMKLLDLDAPRKLLVTEVSLFNRYIHRVLDEDREVPQQTREES